MTTQPAQSAAPPTPTIVDHAGVEQLPWEPLEGSDGVLYKLIWRSGKSVTGLMHVPAGREMSTHTHRRSEHHVWVLWGSAEMMGHRVGPGSYVHVPPGVEHGIGGVGPEGCTVLYMFLRGGDTDGSSPAPGDEEQ